MTIDPVSATFAALADPTRRAILARLALGEASVGELSEPFPMSMPAISKHLKILEQAELISRSKSAQWRRCKLRPEGFRTAASWLQEYQKFWAESFDRLAEHLATMDDQETGSGGANVNRKKDDDHGDG